MKSLKVLPVLLAIGCHVAVNVGSSASNAIPASLMQADRDFADSTHLHGIDGWMSFYTRDAIRIRYRANMVKGYDAIRAFDLPNISDTTTTLNWEPNRRLRNNGYGLSGPDRDRQIAKNPVPFRVRGWLLVAHPSYKLDQ